VKTYKGEYQGRQYSSLYQNLYRVQYRKSIGGRRPYDIDEIVSATDEYHARGRCQGDIRGGVKVEFLHALDLNN
jgi:hypothetical protein